MRIEITKTVSREIKGDLDTIQRWRKRGWTIETIDDEEVLDWCEGYGKPIMTDYDFGSYGGEDAPAFCKACCTESRRPCY